MAGSGCSSSNVNSEKNKYFMGYKSRYQVLKVAYGACKCPDA